jgi:hypothetical protein
MADEVVVKCTRCEDLDVPGVPSSRVDCCQCGRGVWLALDTIMTIRKRYPSHAVKPTCMKCHDPGDFEVANLPEQVEILRATGDSDDVIAYKLAIAGIAGGTATLEEAEAEIRAFPNGERAVAFPAAYRRARLAVAATRLSSN